MAKVTEPTVQLATRIPKSLHRDLKLYCVENEVSLMAVVEKAIRKAIGK